jgi:hypothetical protein
MSIMPVDEPYAWLVGLAAVLRGIAAVVAAVRSARAQGSAKRR